MALRVVPMLCFIVCGGAIDLKALDDGLMYAMKWPGTFTDDLMMNLEPGAELVDMRSAVGEEYKCVIPPLNTPTEGSKADYSGPNALELLDPLVHQTSCSFRLESYWTYEVCHGKYVRQYHQETGRNAKVQEYYLGKWDADRYKKEVAKLNEEIQSKTNVKLPTKKIDGINMPYVEMNMTDGTTCDLSGQSRSVRVLYICYRQGKHEIYSLEETQTCEYEVIVLSPLLCTHPDYRVRDQLHNDITCYSEDTEHRRPKALRDMEAESMRLRHQTTIFELQTGPGKRYTVEINPIDIQEVMERADKIGGPTDDDNNDDATATVPVKGGGWRKRAAGVPARVPKPDGPPSRDAKLVEDFLSGDYCLHGGTGWWKYEFCYGKKVLQYHVEPNGQKSTVLLGKWDEDAHLEWLMQNPKKRPGPGQKKSVSHFYSGGSVCDLTGKPRNVEVKLKCRELSGAGSLVESANAVSLYLLEPEVCSYVLGVESPILCHVLDSADEFGFMTYSNDAVAPAASAGFEDSMAKIGVVEKDGQAEAGVEPTEGEELVSEETAAPVMSVLVPDASPKEALLPQKAGIATSQSSSSATVELPRSSEAEESQKEEL